MRLVCAPTSNGFDEIEDSDFEVVLYGYPDENNRGAIGGRIREVIRQKRLLVHRRAWDLLSLALSVVAADTCVRRDDSPDGWTRELELYIAVSDPDFWNSQKELVEQQLRFLTTDLWQCTFMEGGFSPIVPRRPLRPQEDCVSLLSGGLDSLVGGLDLVAHDGRKPYMISQVAQGDKYTQSGFANAIGGGLRHLQLNHNVQCPSNNERSQRARSLIFLTYGVLAATALRQYHEGNPVTLFVCENGFISINPPLTDGRIGSLSTRTTHPIFISQFQQLLDAAGIQVNVENPYQLHTKGEMLAECSDQAFLLAYAHEATSCGRYARNGYRHCGRCIPCLVRRAAFHAWVQPDHTTYIYENLARNDDDYARFDDVRSVAMAIAQVRTEGFDDWLSTSLSTTLMGDVGPYRQTVERGLQELSNFFEAMGIR